MRSRKNRPFRRAHLSLDLLENRLAPALFVVNTLADTVDPDADVTSLREALQDANANPGADTIHFNVDGTINVLTQLPFLSDATGGTTIDGTTAPSYEGNPVLRLQGPGTGSLVNGLHVTSANNTIRALEIGGFTSGIEMRGAGVSGNLVTGCYLGNDGSVATPNTHGITLMQGAHDNTVGGIAANDGNVISGNVLYGVFMEWVGTDNNVVIGNKFGTTADGLFALGNGGGLRITGGASHNRIGTDGDGAGDAAERNVISGNAFGISFDQGNTAFNSVAGNYIGLNALGTALPNTLSGVSIHVDAHHNTIGGPTDVFRNVISATNGTAGFQGNGIFIHEADNNLIQNNFIGTDATGGLDVGNVANGILVTTNASGNVIQQNVISGNNGSGIKVELGSTGTLVNNNAIGADLTGTIDLGNGGHGMQITNGAGNVQIDQNVIAFNDADGVHMTSTAGTGVQMTNNSFFSNGRLGINQVSATDNAAGVTPNDPLDADSGPNNLQNAPVISKAVALGTGTSITYSLHSTPNTFFLVQIYRSPSADPSGFGEGKTLVINRGLTTDANGNAGETFTTGIIPIGQAITATAMSSNTSEFSNAVKVAKQITWTGAVSANWSDPANWGAAVPAAGDHLVFGPGSSSTLVNDLPVDTEISSLSFAGGNYTVSGNRIRLGDGGITITAGSAYVEQDNAIDPICIPIVVETGSLLTLAGILSGPGGMHKEGLGTAILSGANTFAGVTHVEEGVLRIEHGQALGSSASGTEVTELGALEMAGGITVANEFLEFRAQPDGIIAILIGLRSVSGANTWTGGWAIDPICIPIVVETGSLLTMSGQISGDGGMHKDGDGTFVLAAANTYAGVTHVEGGTLRLENSLALGSTTLGTEVMAGAELQLQGGIAVNGESLTINPSSIIAILIGIRSTSGNNAWSGPISMALPHVEQDNLVSVGVDPGSQLTLSGIIDGPINTNLEKFGDGTLIVSAANTYTGATTVEDGTLLVNGSIASSMVSVDGGVLGGMGIIGQTEVLSGNLRPGNSPGLLTVAGDVTFAAGTSFDVELNGTTAGAQYDQLAVQGTVDLGGATLNASVGYASNVGDRFVIISNDGSDAVTGTFAGLAEGATLALSGKPYRISYVGGDGNDVELVRLGVGVVNGNLIVDGTSADDRIRIISRGDDDCDDDDPARVTVRMNGEVVGRFASSSFQQIIVHGLAGDDHLHVSNRIDKPAFLYGDDGEDHLKGGAGNDVLLGGDGDDRLHGHHGRDLLIGGRGGDRIIGEHDDDLLIASFTAFDNDASALSAIMAEWTRTDQNYDQRVGHLRSGGGNNGSVVLVAEGSGATVFDDGAEDRLTGNQGRDWFFANLTGAGVLDKITDWNDNEDGDDF